MSVKRYKFTVEIEAHAFVDLYVELPDGLTEEQVDARIDEAIDGAVDEINDALCDDAETTVHQGVEGYSFAPPPPPDTSPLPIPDEAWTRWNLRRWATDGDVLVREGAPAFETSAARKPWFGTAGARYPVTAPDVLDNLQTTLGDPRSADPLVDPRFRPLFAAADRAQTHGDFGAICLYDGDGLLAIVMPMRMGGLPMSSLLTKKEEG